MSYLLLYILCAIAAQHQAAAGGCRCRRRRLGDETEPMQCTGFPKQNCPLTPSLNPDMSEPDGLSTYAHDWMAFTCCQLATQPLREVIATTWMWWQVCTQAMSSATAESYQLDAAFKDKKGVTVYNDGPLHSMKHYCPRDLDGGELNVWVVSTFFPFVESSNPNFKIFSYSVAECKAKKSPGAVTILLTTSPGKHSYGHIHMVLHEDHNLDLPADLDTKHYVSWGPETEMLGTMITGTKADKNRGFGLYLKKVTKVVTLYNVDTDAMVKKWDSIKKSGQMFDVVNWNCARTLLEVLQAGYPDCRVSFDQLWVPERAWEYIKQVETKVNSGVTASKTVTLESVQSRQIEPSAQDTNDNDDFPVMFVVVAVLVSFFGTLIFAALVAGIVIFKIKDNAAQQLEKGLAHILIHAAAGDTGGPPSRPAKSERQIAPYPTATDSINAEMGHNGTANFEEFSAWAKEHNLTDKQAKLMWKDLDHDHNNSLSKKEWANFIHARPNLKFLLSRVKSVRHR